MKHEFLRRTGRTALGLALSLTMAASILPGVALAEEAGGATDTAAVKVENKYLGTDVMASPAAPQDSAAWNGSYVYYGAYTSKSFSNLKFRVLNQNETAFGGSSLFLDGDDIIDGWNASAPRTKVYERFHDWLNSTGTNANGGFLKDFTDQEKAAILASTKAAGGSGKTSHSALNQDKVFVLSEEEARNTSYGYSSGLNTDKVTYRNRQRPRASNYHVFWLRTTYNVNGNDISEVVLNWPWGGNQAGAYYIGQIQLGNYPASSINAGIVPAMNIDASKILFSNLLTGTASELDAEYKLTILDDNISVKDTPTAEREETEAADTTATADPHKITVTYELDGTNKGSVKKLGLMVLNKPFDAGKMSKDDMVAYYESSVSSTDGQTTAEFTLTEAEDNSTYSYYIVPVVENANKSTDYAGTPVKVEIPALQTEAQYTITLNKGNATDKDKTDFSDKGVDDNTIFVYANYAFRDSGYEVKLKTEDGTETQAEDSPTVKRQYRVKPENGTATQNGDDGWKDLDEYTDSETITDKFTITKEEYSKTYEIKYTIEGDEESEGVTRQVVVIYKRGDVNRDGNVNASDANDITAHTKSIVTIPLTDEFYKQKTADVNKDGNVNAGDAGDITSHTKGIVLIQQDYNTDETNKVMTFVKNDN